MRLCSIFFLAVAPVLLPFAKASNFVDLNSLQGFSQAVPQAEEVLAYAQSRSNDTITSDTSSNPSFRLSQTSSPSSTSSPELAQRAPGIPKPPSPEDIESEELVKRARRCSPGYGSCVLLGAPRLCCPSNQICSADYAGQVACCPIGAVCTGVVPGGPAPPTVVPPVTTTTKTAPGGSSGFVIVGTNTVAVLGNGGSSRADLKSLFVFKLVTIVIRAADGMFA